MRERREELRKEEAGKRKKEGRRGREGRHKWNTTQSALLALLDDDVAPGFMMLMY